MFIYVSLSKYMLAERVWIYVLKIRKYINGILQKFMKTYQQSKEENKEDKEEEEHEYYSLKQTFRRRNGFWNSELFSYYAYSCFNSIAAEKR